MKVLIINTFDTGGAAQACIRLHLGLLAQGIDSRLLLKKKTNHSLPNCFQIVPKGFKPGLKDRLKIKLGLPVLQEDKNKKLIEGLSGKYETLTFPLTDDEIENHPFIQECDIINLHWVSKFINYPAFFKKVKKPIIWTLHDMNPLLGMFHYMGDVERNKQAFGALDDSFRQQKKQWVANATKMQVVTPSTWLGTCAKESEVLGKFPVEIIPYGLDLTVFKPYDIAFAKEVFNLPHDKKIILFVSETLQNYRKGFDLLLEAFEKLNLGNEFVIATVGEGKGEPIKLGGNVYHLGKVSDNRLMALAYSCASLFVLPSREDNFPNVMLEAFACGTPVVGFAIGGLLDTIRTGFNGILVEQIDASLLRDAIQGVINGNYTFDRNAIREFAVEKYDLAIQAKKYIELYSRTLSI